MDTEGKSPIENPVDHIVALGLVNYVKHPTNQNYVVYRFADEERAKSFEKALLEKEIWHEKSTDDSKSRPYYLFGIHKNDYKKTQVLNFEVEASHKKPFIPFSGLRYGLILFSMTVLILAVMGYCKSQEKLASYNNSDLTINTDN
jgi:hypothetical protein